MLRSLLCALLLALLSVTASAEPSFAGRPGRVAEVMTPCLEQQLGPSFPVAPKFGTRSSGVYVGYRPYYEVRPWSRWGQPGDDNVVLHYADTEDPDTRPDAVMLVYTWFSGSAADADSQPAYLAGVTCFDRAVTIA
jgi:hypothetical protein